MVKKLSIFTILVYSNYLFCPFLAYGEVGGFDSRYAAGQPSSIYYEGSLLQSSLSCIIGSSAHEAAFNENLNTGRMYN